MEYNNYIKKYNNLKYDLTLKSKERTKLVDQLNEYLNTNVKSLQYSLDMEKEKNKKIISTINFIETEINNLQKKIQEQNLLIKHWFNPLYWFNIEQKKYRKNYQKIEQKISLKKEEKEQIESTLLKSNTTITELDKRVIDYLNFDEEKTNINIVNISRNITLLETDLKYMEKQKIDIDKKLKPILSRIKDIEQKISNQKIKLEKAKSFEIKLQNASGGKRNIHNECKHTLGNERPKDIIKKLKPQLESSKRTLNKLRKEAEEVEKNVLRVIKKIVIDGNNMCYEDKRDKSKFIGLQPLIVTTSKLQTKYKVTIVFDHDILKILNYKNEKAIKAYFDENITVHIVASEEKADETILGIASDDRECYIISNDRFAEYNKEVIQNKRIIRHEIVSGKIFIHDLFINEIYER